MKFKCGPTAEEKVRTMENWHDHFAWWPVKMGSTDCRWLETVQRRYDIWHINLGGVHPIYREKQDD